MVNKREGFIFDVKKINSKQFHELINLLKIIHSKINEIDAVDIASKLMHCNTNKKWIMKNKMKIKNKIEIFRNPNFELDWLNLDNENDTDYIFETLSFNPNFKKSWLFNFPDEKWNYKKIVLHKNFDSDCFNIIRSKIDKIKNNLSKFTTNEVTLNIKEVKKPETNAYLVAENIAQQLVKRISYRRAMKRAMQSCLRLGARGIKVSISGRLGGNEIARTEWLRDGSIPSHTLRADIDYAEAEALTTYGIIGIKVWIYKGEVFAKEFSQETNKITPKEGKE